MNKNAPTFGRLAAMTIFALSCFGLLLFLWLAFGGPIPLKPEGYLFWAAWANHLAPAFFGTQDAHGPIRRGQVIFSCNTLVILDNVAAANPQLGTLVGLLNPPRQACQQPGAPAPTGTSAPAPSPAPTGGTTR